MKTSLLFISLLFLTTCKSNFDYPFDNILDSKNKAFQNIIQQADTYEIQIRYTQIDRNKDSKTVLSTYEFNVDTTKYFYPASTVKMHVAFLALQKINELKDSLNNGINKYSKLQIDSIRPAQKAVLYDSTATNYEANIAHYINKVFAVSDNDAYNRLYEFCGQDYINKELRKKGIFGNSRIRTRVGISGFSTVENRHTPSISFLEKEELLYQQNEQYAILDDFEDIKDTQKGVGYSDADGNIIMQAFDMSQKNFINLRDLEASLQRVILPEIFDSSELYYLEKEDYVFLKKSLGSLPRDHKYLQENLDEYYDSYVKFFMFGDSKNSMPKHIKIHNKVGVAYGYLTDCAYIHDAENDIEFFLTATIHVNENQIYNDGNYEYDDIGIPFLAELGRRVYAFEKERKK